MPTTKADLDRWEKTRDTEKFVQILRYLSGDKYLNMRLHAIAALGAQPSFQHIPLLVSEMGNSPDSQDKVAEILVNWGADAAEAIAQYLNTPFLPTRVIRCGLQTIGRYDPQISYTIFLRLLLLYRYTGLVCDNLHQIGMTPRFYELLNDSDPIKRWVGLEVINRSPIASASCKLLCENMADEDVQIRTACYKICENFVRTEDESEFDDISRTEFKERIEAQVRKGLFDEEAGIRTLALSIIGKITDGVLDKDEDRIIELSFDEDQDVRKGALYALGSFFHHETKLMILSHYLEPENDERHRAFALRALGTCIDDGSYEILEGILYAESDIRLLAICVESLLSRDHWNRAVPLLITQLLRKAQLRQAIDQYTRRNPDAADLCFEVISRETNRLRIKASIWLVGELGVSKNIEGLFDLADISEDYIEDLACAAYQLINTLEMEPVEFFSQIDTKGNPGREKLKSLMVTRLEDDDYEWEDGFRSSLL